MAQGRGRSCQYRQSVVRDQAGQWKPAGVSHHGRFGRGKRVEYSNTVGTPFAPGFVIQGASEPGSLKTESSPVFAGVATRGRPRLGFHNSGEGEGDYAFGLWARGGRVENPVPWIGPPGRCTGGGGPFTDVDGTPVDRGPQRERARGGAGCKKPGQASKGRLRRRTPGWAYDLWTMFDCLARHWAEPVGARRVHVRGRNRRRRHLDDRRGPGPATTSRDNFNLKKPGSVAAFYGLLDPVVHPGPRLWSQAVRAGIWANAGGRPPPGIATWSPGPAGGSTRFRLTSGQTTFQQHLEGCGIGRGRKGTTIEG